MEKFEFLPHPNKVPEAPSAPDIDDHSENEEETPSPLPPLSCVTVEKEGHSFHCLTIIGQIEGHHILAPHNKTTKYEQVIPQLVAIEESKDIDGLLLILNTVGGDVEAGLAIAELIAGMTKPSVSLVLGGGHSIGVPLAVAAKKSFISASATMTVHPVRMTGMVLGVSQTLAYFERMQERIVRFVAGHSRMDGDRFRELMLATGQLVLDVGTSLSGEDAVNEGLIGQVGTLSDALKALVEQTEQMKADKKQEAD